MFIVRPMRKTTSSTLHLLNAGFSVLSVLLLAVMIIVPFLQIDRNFNISPSFSLAKVVSTWDIALLSALWNSAQLSVIASLFAIACGGLLDRFINKKQIWLFALMIAVYAINPVARALSYFDLFNIYTPFYKLSAAIVGDKFSSNIFLPALILGMHYLPIYMMRNLFVLKKRNIAHDIPPLMETLFDNIPVWARGFPISFALFFLLTFFDYWVIQVISGNTVLYWTPLFVQKGFQARAVSEAALMIVLGLLATVVAYLAALLISRVLQFVLRRLRPLWFTALSRRRTNMNWVWTPLSWLALVFAAWPLVGSVIKFFILFSQGAEFKLVTNTDKGIIAMLILGCGMGIVSATLALILSICHQERPSTTAWWMPALYFLALVPEAAFVLFSLFVTGAGLLKGNPIWLFFLMASFSVPMSFFLWESLWGEAEKRKIFLIGPALMKHPWTALPLAIKEWRRPWSIVFVVSFWLAIDNVFITDFSAGPQWKTLSAIIFNATKRGFSAAEYTSSVLGTVSVLVVIAVVLLSNRTSAKDA